jgi:hypothetical protein
MQMNKRSRMIGEFVLVVVGVLVALMVEAGLESRQDDQLRDEYLSRLEIDLGSDKGALEGRIEFFTDVQRFSKDVLDWLDSDAQVDQGLLLASFYAAEVWPLTPNASTYLDLHSTGNIRLLDDIDLRTSMAVYYNKADSTMEGMTPSEDYRQVVRGVIPTEVQDLMRENCPTTDEADQSPSGFPPCSLPDVDYEQINRLYAPLRTDVEFRRVLTYRHSELGVMLYLLGQQAAFATEALSKIERHPAEETH